MKSALLIVFLLFTQCCFGQAKGLQKIAGTKCSMVPPDGFVTATAFSGFQNSEIGASIMINEIPAPYQSIVNGFTPNALKTKGIIWISTEKIELNKTSATLIKATQAANGTTYHKMMLIFGDKKQTILVNGIYPEAAKGTASAISAALLTSVYDPIQEEKTLEAATFSIAIKNTDFKLVKYMSGSLLYSTDGKIPTNKPTLIVGNSIAKITSQNLKQFAQTRLKQLPEGYDNEIKQTNEITIDNLKGYEIIAEGKTKNNLTQLIYQVILFNNTGDYYMILGQSNEDFDMYLTSFRQIAKTFKRK